jgi:hypothetical protein
MAILKMAGHGAVQMSRFYQQTLAEIAWPDNPAERLGACRNPLLAEDRRHTRAARAGGKV